MGRSKNKYEEWKNESYYISKEAINGLAKWLLKVFFIYIPLTVAAIASLLLLINYTFFS
jgi:hypothetical protein